MRPWTIDADDIEVSTDFDEQLLHRTPRIEDFLDPSDDKFIVVGSKGFGKTLLLKAKRIEYQDLGRPCIPQDALLDKPVGDKVFSREMLRFFGEGTEPWTKTWLTSIALAVLKQLERTQGLELSARLANVMGDRHLRTVLDHLVVLLDFAPGDLHRAANEVNSLLVPRLRALNAPVAIFIDSVDEYFDKHIHAPRRRSTLAGELSPDIWFLAQMGLVEVAYQLRRISKHLKVFAAVRREAFAKLAATTPMVQQYRGSAVEVLYTEASLRQIFVNNVLREKPRNLVHRSKLPADPMQAFLGRTHVVHGFTGEKEDAFDYIARHTLLRPRDLMTVGQRLVALSPKERQEERRFKVAVHGAASEIAQEYLNEIAPHIGEVDLEALLALFPANVMSRATLEEVAKRYDAQESPVPRDPGMQALGALIDVGLLGCVRVDPGTGRPIQRFLGPGDAGLDRDGGPPASPYYLVRSVLSDYIAAVNPAYAERTDRSNTVGDGRPWRDPQEPTGRVEERSLAVLKADVVGFRRRMRDDRLDQVVRRALAAAVREHASACVHAEVVGGDSVSIVDADPAILVRIATRLKEDVFHAPSHPQLRIALDFGAVKLEERAGSPTSVAGGLPLLRVARIEPHVKAGEVWATEEFKVELERHPSLYGATEVEGGVNIKKAGSAEDDALLRVYRIAPR